MAAQYRQIGNATPLAIGEVISHAIMQADIRKNKGQHTKKLYCADPMLLRRLIQRPKTMLNPVRMRKIKGKEQARLWLNSRENKRTDFEKYEAMSPTEAAVGFE